jgi:addiction module HigA family antidote
MVSSSFQPVSVAHPGTTVVDYLESYGWSQSDLARRSDLTPKTISEICNGKAPISPTTSLALERVLGRPAHFWLSLQARFDEARARQSEAVRSAGWAQWVREFPLNDMRKQGWLPSKKSPAADVTALLGFLGVSSPDSWSAVWGASGVSYRQTRRFATSIHAVSAWVRATELAAESIELSGFYEDRLTEKLSLLRGNTRRPINEAMDRAQALCASFGVAFVIVPAFPQTGISGCARWFGDKAIIALSLRYRTDDQVWFTFFHELGHVLKHRKRQVFVLDNAHDNLTDGIVDPEMQAVEDEANRFAADTLIPPSSLHAFLSAGVFTSDAIHVFAESINVAPGIVVGRLQKEGLLAAHQGNRLKQRLEINIVREEED